MQGRPVELRSCACKIGGRVPLEGNTILRYRSKSGGISATSNSLRLFRPLGGVKRLAVDVDADGVLAGLTGHACVGDVRSRIRLPDGEKVTEPTVVLIFSVGFKKKLKINGWKTEGLIELALTGCSDFLMMRCRWNGKFGL